MLLQCDSRAPSQWAAKPGSPSHVLLAFKSWGIQQYRAMPSCTKEENGWGTLWQCRPSIKALKVHYVKLKKWSLDFLETKDVKCAGAMGYLPRRADNMEWNQPKRNVWCRLQSWKGRAISALWYQTQSYRIWRLPLWVSVLPIPSLCYNASLMEW